MRIFKNEVRANFLFMVMTPRTKLGESLSWTCKGLASPSTNVWGGMGAVKFISSSASYSAYLEGKGSREQR